VPDEIKDDTVIFHFPKIIHHIPKKKKNFRVAYGYSASPALTMAKMETRSHNSRSSVSRLETVSASIGPSHSPAELSPTSAT
jgi:hypothetical protein